VISGDPTQTDLPHKVQSGLLNACRLLEHIDGIKVCRFGKGDVLRHSLVERIVRAYEEDKHRKGTEEPGE
jgi:phosphate starvation-inducible PhoH-like protein